MNDLEKLDENMLENMLKAHTERVKAIAKELLKRQGKEREH